MHEYNVELREGRKRATVAVACLQLVDHVADFLCPLLLSPIPRRARGIVRNRQHAFRLHPDVVAAVAAAAAAADRARQCVERSRSRRTESPETDLTTNVRVCHGRRGRVHATRWVTWLVGQLGETSIPVDVHPGQCLKWCLEGGHLHRHLGVEDIEAALARVTEFHSSFPMASGARERGRDREK